MKLKKGRKKVPNRRLTKLRESANLTQKQLGDSLTMSQSMIARIENGDRDPSSDIKISIARFFGVTIEWLFYDQVNDLKSLKDLGMTGT